MWDYFLNRCYFIVMSSISFNTFLVQEDTFLVLEDQYERLWSEIVLRLSLVCLQDLEIRNLMKITTNYLLTFVSQIIEGILLKGI